VRFLEYVTCLLAELDDYSLTRVQEKNRIEDIGAIVSSVGKPFEYIPLRLEDAFDPVWWARIGGGNLETSADALGLDMSDEG
jgi:cytoplasmic tRNA 2-thiolation protein 2